MMRPAVFVHVGEAFAHIRPLVEQVAENGLPADAQIVYEGRNTIAVVPGSDYPICIKAYKRPHLINRIAYGILRPSKAERAFRNAAELLRTGIATPEPIAFAEVRIHGLLTRSYYFCRYYPDTHDVRDIITLPERDNMFGEIAALMLKMHRSGVLFKDFSPGNLLYRIAPDGSREYMLVDINRMRFGVHNRRQQLTMFARLIHSEKFTLQLARHYLKAGGTDPDSPQGLNTIRAVRCAYRSFWRSRHRLPPA